MQSFRFSGSVGVQYSSGEFANPLGKFIQEIAQGSTEAKSEANSYLVTRCKFLTFVEKQEIGNLGGSAFAKTISTLQQ